jgi:Tfp pilus assembly protein PilF
LLGREQDLPPVYVETYLPWRYFGWAPLTALRSTRWKLIVAPRPELYDLSVDPGEQNNLYDREPARAEAMREELAARIPDAQGEAATVTDLQTLDRLRALGYVGVGAEPGSPAAELADPKDRIELRNKLTRAEDALRQGRFAEALALFDEVLAEDPGNHAATLRSGVTWLKRGDPARAVPLLEEAARLDPDRGETRFALGDALTRLGQWERAAEQWRELTRLLPSRVDGWSNMGLTLLAAGRSEEAVAALERALELAPEEPTVRRNLGRALLERAGALAGAGRDGEARAALQRALEQAPELREAARADARLAGLSP